MSGITKLFSVVSETAGKSIRKIDLSPTRKLINRTGQTVEKTGTAAGRKILSAGSTAGRAVTGASKVVAKNTAILGVTAYGASKVYGSIADELSKTTEQRQLENYYDLAKEAQENFGITPGYNSLSEVIPSLYGYEPAYYLPDSYPSTGMTGLTSELPAYVSSSSDSDLIGDALLFAGTGMLAYALLQNRKKRKR